MIKNVDDLRIELDGVFAELRSGALDTKTVTELNNTAGKMIASAKVELQYYDMLGIKQKIPFLTGPYAKK